MGRTRVTGKVEPIVKKWLSKDEAKSYIGCSDDFLLYLYRYLTTNRTDTVLKNDSIRVPYPVEKRLSRWQSIKMELGGWAFGLVIAFILIIIGRIVYRTRK